MKMMVAGLGLLAMACATVPAEEGPAREGMAGHCDAAAAASLAGRPATSELGADALARTGARTLRWIRPGDAVTMDYRTDRLNIELDGEGRIARFTCG